MDLIERIWDMAVVLASAGLIGYISEKYVLTRLKKAADLTKWECDEIVVTALRGRVMKWCLIGGTYAALSRLPLTPEIARWTRDGLFVLFVLSATAAVSDVAVGIINLCSKHRRNVFPSTSIFTHLTSCLLFIIGSIIIMQSLGISIAPLLTALGVGGLAVALALQETLSNFFAGLHILISRPIRPADYIRLDTGEAGYVVDITWRNTSIRTLKENMIIIPNSKMAAAKITNYSLPTREVVFHVPLKIEYGSDLPAVERITGEVARDVLARSPGGAADYRPVVRFAQIGERSVSMNVILCAREFSAQYFVRHEFLKALQERYQKEGVGISLPEQTIYLAEEKGTRRDFVETV